MALALGETRLFSGDVTTLQWIKPGYEAQIETALGYHHNRLINGYFIVLLTRKPLVSEFKFSGTTLRSGGKEGLPAATVALDNKRPSVHDKMQANYGAAQYVQMQTAAIKTVAVQGDSRVCKVLPDVAHDPNMAPQDQYPMGGGGLQWTLLKPGLPFLVAVRVNADGTADTKDFSVDLRTGGYDARAKLRSYMMNA